MERSAILFLLSMALYGCTTTRMVTSAADPDTRWFEHFNRDAEGRTISIVKRDGSNVTGSDAVASRDSLVWNETVWHGRAALRFDSVESITINAPLYGMAEGIGYGFLTGGTAGIVWAGLEDPDPDETGGLRYLFYSALGAGGGAVIGGVIGHRTEHHIIYRIPHPAR